MKEHRTVLVVVAVFMASFLGGCDSSQTSSSAILALASSGRDPEWIVHDEVVIFNKSGCTRVLDLRPYRLEATGDICVSERLGHILFHAKAQESAYKAKPTVEPGILRYNLTTQKLEHFVKATGVAVSPDGKRLAYAYKRTLRVISYPGGDDVHTIELPKFRGHPGWNLHWVSDKILVVSYLSELQFKVNLMSREIERLSSDKRRMRYSKDGAMLAYFEQKGFDTQPILELFITDTQSGKKLTSLPEHNRHGRLTDFKWGCHGYLYYVRSIGCVVEALLALKCGDMIGRYDPATGKTRVVVKHMKYLSGFVPISGEFVKKIRKSSGETDKQ